MNITALYQPFCAVFFAIDWLPLLEDLAGEGPRIGNLGDSLVTGLLRNKHWKCSTASYCKLQNAITLCISFSLTRLSLGGSLRCFDVGGVKGMLGEGGRALDLEVDDGDTPREVVVFFLSDFEAVGLRDDDVVDDALLVSDLKQITSTLKITF